MTGTSQEPEYRYALYDLLSRERLTDHMPFTVQSYARSLGEAGTTSASLNVADRAVFELEPWDRTIPRKTTLVVLRDNVVVGEFIIWQRPPYKPTEKKLNISASEIRSYFDHRILRPTGGVGSTKTLSFDQQDQFRIFRDLVTDAQSVLHNGDEVGNIGIELDSSLSGVLRDRKDAGDDKGAYHGYEFPVYGELLDNLANVDNGFEWRVDSFLDEEFRLRRALRLGYPYLGHGPDEGAVVLEYPGAIVDYEWSEDGSDRVNYVAAIGAGEEAAIKWGEAFNETELTNGYPLLERTTAYKSASVQTTLNSHASADVKALTGDLIMPTLTVRGRPNVSPGDYIKVRISDESRFRGSTKRPFEAFMRATQITTVPGPPEITTISVEEPRVPGDE